MGRAIAGLAAQDKAFFLTALVEAAGSPAVGKDHEGVRITDSAAEAMKKIDAAIDFTAPLATLAHAAQAAEAGVPLVIGTTGIDEAGQAKLKEFARKTPIVFAPNMSLSANVMFEIAERVAALLPGYDAEIAEIHHNLKKDAPSGTALRLAESLRRGRKGGRLIFGREGQVGARKPDEIGVHAVRGGDVVGDHTVFFLGTGERIELTHRVTSRAALAAGALAAAKWVVGRAPGLYDMRDVLGMAK
jgi:4-hydroxy-tetrahydrodipicolinate reductase